MANPILPKTEGLLAKAVAAAKKQREHIDDCCICREAVKKAEREDAEGKPGYLCYCERGMELQRESKEHGDNYLRLKEKVSVN